MISKFETKTKVKSLAALTLALFFVFNPVLGQNSSVDSLNAQKTANQKKLEELNKQIKNYTQQIDTARKSANSLKNEIFIYDREIASTELLIQAKETQIEDTNLQIQELERLIEKKVIEIKENKKILGELIKELYKYDSQYMLKTTLGSGNLSDFLNQVEHTQNFQHKIYQLVQKIKELKAKLEEQEKELRIQLQNLEELREQLETSKKALVGQRSQKQTLLTQTRGIEQNFQKLLTVSKNEEEKIEKEIQDLDAQIRAKLGNRTIAAKKGVLAWPMDGIVTQKYGKTGFTALGYNFHNAIDIAAPAGQPIYASADGEVMYTDSSDQAYGNWVAIKHNITTKNGSSQIVTLYAHMRSFKVKPGQKVLQGDLIGYEGNTGNTTKKLYGPERGYHIHFGVYDLEGFGVNNGLYGSYRVPYGYTYNPMDFL